MKINFFGTNEFAKVILQGLIDNSNFEIETVFTMPDRPVGRKQILQRSPVKILAEEYNLKVEQPTSLKDYSLLSTPYSLNIVCDYGIIIPKNILEIPKFGSINIHPSLLPKYRGASPIQSVIINGEKQTGITVMLMDEKMDHGPILAQKIINIAPDSTYLELYNKLALEAQNLTNLTCLDWINGKITPQPQDDSLATFCQEFGRGDGQINWHKSAEEIYNQYRGMTPWPGVFTFLNSKRLKLITINVPDSINTNQNVGFASRPVGVIIVESGKIFVNCGDNNSIEILELQLEGKNKLNAAEFVKGQKNLRGIRLSS